MPGVRLFTDLEIWKRARAWSKEIFQFTKKSPFNNDRRLVEQINDSSESVISNIAEGFGRGTQNEFVTFLGYSLGSLNETQSIFARLTIENTYRPTTLAASFKKARRFAK